jgi:xanthine dehydrogenase/oxidase
MHALIQLVTLFLVFSAQGKPSEEEIENALGGNLCRCTGYRPILDGFRVFAKTDERAYTDDALAAAGAPAAAKPAADAGAPICPSTGQPCTAGCGGAAPAAAGCETHEAHADSLTGASEPIFPPELRRRATAALTLPGAVAAWHRPVTLAALLALRAAHPGSRLVGGNTEVGIEVKFKHARYPVLITASAVPEMQACGVDAASGAVHLGAGASLSAVEACLHAAAHAAPEHAGRGWRAVVAQLRWFAGRQIRNVATLGGNIATGSPISDLNPLWIALGATFVLASLGDGGAVVERRAAARGFFKGYRQVDINAGETLLRVEVPPCGELEYAAAFKQAHRRDDDIALANAGMRVSFVRDAAGLRVQAVHLAFGGMAAMTVAAPAAEAALAGGAGWDRAALDAALAALASSDLPLSAGAPGGMVEYRRSLAASFLFKFFVQVAQALERDVAGFEAPLGSGERSAAVEAVRPPPRGVQAWAASRDAPGAARGGAGAPLMHASAELQATGEAVYVDDAPQPANLLHAARVGADRPHATLLSLDASAACAMPGVAGFFGAASVPGDNACGPVLHDEVLFVPIGGEVTCVGALLGIVVAETEAQARAAARAVKATYLDLPSILTIDEAVAAGTFHDNARLTGHALQRGDPDAVLAGAEAAGLRVFEGVARCGGQEHFYLEPQCSVVTPGEGGLMDVLSSTQAPAENQREVARACGLPHHRVTCRVKRLGGGFGGKESRAAAVAAAASVPAFLLHRPVRFVLDRDEDMATTGHRHAFMSRFKVAAQPDGTIVALSAQLYSNGGNSMDLSHSIMDRALFHSDGCYAIPHLHVAGTVCATHLPSNTAFRGFGGPQGQLLTEMVVDRVARELGLDPTEVRRRNLYPAVGAVAHYGQAVEAERIHGCWADVEASAAYGERAAAVAAFNATSRYRKRGLALVPCKFGISFTTTFLNQAGALVHVYTDGSVLLSHGGVEMGQGLHTKMAQVAATCLGLPVGRIIVSETHTGIVANASPTAASASADLYGGAIQDACEQLLRRLAPFQTKGVTWEAAVNAAYFARVDLSAHGFLATGGLDWNWARPLAQRQGTPFNYHCFGCAATEVELDALTGDMHVVRVDITMDVGDSLNPAIDVGQIEGGFVQGLGWLTLEELKWGDSEHAWGRKGHLLTSGPGTYKLPSVGDIPRDMRVSLLRGASNPRAVLSSKAVGEPPFLLALSAFFAAKAAAAAARAEGPAGAGAFDLDAPATPERLRLACSDALTAALAPPGTRAKLSC